VGLGAGEVVLLGDKAITPVMTQLAVGEAGELLADAKLQPPPELCLVHGTSQATMADH
jgi:hypothetical protein